jgi:hypothetical protein
VAEDFQRKFERLVVLDYITRNTDRSNSNWLIKHVRKEKNSAANGDKEVL